MEQLQHAEMGGTKGRIPESIKSAAIIFNGVTYTGVNHATAIRELEKVQPNWHRTSQESVQEGFVTSSDRFVSREEASDIAYRADQLSHLNVDERPDLALGLDSSHLRH